METQNGDILAHPVGEQPAVDSLSAIADTFAGRVHVEWDSTAPVTAFGQLPFFIDYLKQAGLFDAWVADCPLAFTSPNAPSTRDVLGTVLLSVLSGHRRYAHITALRCDPVNPPLLGMRKVVSEDAVRRGLAKIEEADGLRWLQNHLDYCTAPLLGEPWILDMDSTVKPLYGHQEGAEIGYNPRKPGRPSHAYHTYFLRTCGWCCASMCCLATRTTSPMRRMDFGNCSIIWGLPAGRRCCAVTRRGVSSGSWQRLSAMSYRICSACVLRKTSDVRWNARCGNPIGRMQARAGRATKHRCGCWAGAGIAASSCCAASCRATWR
jgi:hypothetical protein